MKTFEVELKRTSYITLTVEAESKDEAERIAWWEVDERPDSGFANWEIESIEEHEENHD